MFIVRVELHSADEDDYDTLHKAMRDRGFSQTVIFDNGLEYHLPPAEYYAEGERTSSELLRLAQAAARKTGLSASIVVAETVFIRASGLTQVED